MRLIFAHHVVDTELHFASAVTLSSLTSKKPMTRQSRIPRSGTPQHIGASHFQQCEYLVNTGLREGAVSHTLEFLDASQPVLSQWGISEMAVRLIMDCSRDHRFGALSASKSLAPFLEVARAASWAAFSLTRSIQLPSNSFEKRCVHWVSPFAYPVGYLSGAARGA